MSDPSSHSLRLAELNTQILHLELERAELLRQELNNAEARTEEVAAFIGTYNASSSLGGSVATAPPTASPTKRAKKKSTKSAPGKAKRSPSRKRAARGSASGEDRLKQVIAAVKAAGKDGISAKKLSDSLGIPYSAIRTILGDNKTFVQKGEKRASRLFLR